MILAVPVVVLMTVERILPCERGTSCLRSEKHCLLLSAML